MSTCATLEAHLPNWNTEMPDLRASVQLDADPRLQSLQRHRAQIFYLSCLNVRGIFSRRTGKNNLQIPFTVLRLVLTKEIP